MLDNENHSHETLRQTRMNQQQSRRGTKQLTKTVFSFSFVAKEKPSSLVSSCTFSNQGERRSPIGCQSLNWDVPSESLRTTSMVAVHAAERRTAGHVLRPVTSEARRTKAISAKLQSLFDINDAFCFRTCCTGDHGEEVVSSMNETTRLSLRSRRRRRRGQSDAIFVACGVSRFLKNFW
jgi:hypothetical protein